MLQFQETFGSHVGLHSRLRPGRVFRPLALCCWHAHQAHGRSPKANRTRHQSCRRRSCIAATAAPEVERQPSKAIFYKQLTEAAQSGDHQAAEACLVAMTDAGYRPTAHMFHGLIFSYAKAGFTEGAVRYFYACLDEGLQPLPETYATVIHSCLQNHETTIVEEVYSSLLSASIDRRPGWESYLRGLVTLGLTTRFDEPRPLEEAEDSQPEDEDAQPEDEEEKEGSEVEAADFDDVSEDTASSDQVAGELQEEGAEEEETIDQALDPEDRVEIARADRVIWDTDDLKEAGIAELEEDSAESSAPGEDGAADEDEDKTAEEAPSSDASAKDGSDEAAADGGPILNADGYTCLLVTDEPLDLDTMEGVAIREGLVGGTDEDLQSPAVQAALEKLNREPKRMDIIPVEVEGLTLGDSDASKENRFEGSHLKQLENARRPLYHPGKPDGKLHLAAKITETMEFGRQEGWYLDLDTYEKVLKLLFEHPEQAVLAQEILHADLLNRPGVTAETRHVNCLLSAEAIWRGVRHAMRTVDDMIEGKYGASIYPDIHSMNAVLEGCVMERLTGKAYAVEDFQETIGNILMAGMKMNKRTHALQLMMYLQDCDVDKVLWELKEMQHLAAPCMALEELSDYWVAELISFLMGNKCVLEVLRLMLVMQEDGRDMPEELDGKNLSELSFFTSWLPTFLSSCHDQRATSGRLEKNRSIDSYTEVQGVLFDAASNEAVSTETGQVLEVRDMDESQIFLELQMRDIPTTGTASQRAARLERARASAPQKIPYFTGVQSQEEAAKRSKRAQRQAEKEASTPVWIETMSVQRVEHKKAANVYMKVFSEEAKSSAIQGDQSHFENLMSLELSPEVTDLLKEYRLAVNSKEVEQQYALEDRIFNADSPEFLAVNPNFRGQKGFGVKQMWPPFGKGTRLALTLMNLSTEMNGSSTFMDFIQLLEGFIVEKDAEGCYQLIVTLHSLSQRVDVEDLTLFYSKALTLCLECGNMEYVASIASFMEVLGIQPIGLLDDPDFLPMVRETRERVSQMTNYEKEVGDELGEVLGGAETYRMTDLEGRGDGYPEGVSEIYRQPRSEEQVLKQLEILKGDQKRIGGQSSAEIQEDLEDDADLGDAEYDDEDSADLEDQEDYDSDDDDFDFEDDFDESPDLE